MDQDQLVRRLPAVHELLKACAERKMAIPEELHPMAVWTRVAREVLSCYRRLALEEGEAPPGIELLAVEVSSRVQRLLSPSLKRVINATGVVLHTNLGRAPLSSTACAAVAEVAGGYCNLELDLASGNRGLRYSHVQDLLTTLTGAQAAIVVNNNAAAVLLTLQALAHGQEVIVSRGELVEIGGSFRVPEVLEQSGAVLREVGTTNKTHPGDYERAITPETGMLLKVHPSNYLVLGFTSQVSREELVAIGHRHQLPVVEDLGSGVLIDLAQYGLTPEPTVQASLASGVDLVTFSGDKLLGGPQVGVIAGRGDLIAILSRHPLLRALRVDKLALAALEATLQAYQQDTALETLPVLRMITMTAIELYQRAVTLQERLAVTLGDQGILELRAGSSQAGGGSLPVTSLPTTLVALRPRLVSLARLAANLRNGEPPVLARVQDETLLLDPRTIADDEVEQLAGALRRALQG